MDFKIIQDLKTPGQTLGFLFAGYYWHLMAEPLYLFKQESIFLHILQREE